ncbi:Uncharacterised protein [Legionella wadsworthii]|uniref:Uncharacterized protein n=1 Tax=Legionella wadsworthii TaxID=28088 RepID=A0A378LT42_9GAMM|nr:hypothetical protein [Legionella wadsworthii]STY30245.1 Uncharacterised protein [Legionella wadsworthii]
MEPHDCLINLSQKFPNAWNLITQFREQNYFKCEWPSWCFLPNDAWQGIISREYNTSYLKPYQKQEASLLAAVGTWRYTQGIYRFNKNFYEKITEHSEKNNLNESLFYSLPEWSIYIETPDLKWSDNFLYGFWCHLAWDNQKKFSELRFVLNTEKLISISLPLNKGTINNIIHNKLNPGFLPLLSVNPLSTMCLLTYHLCSPRVDIINPLGKIPRFPEPKMYKGNLKIFPPNNPSFWTVDLNETYKNEINISKGNFLRN